MAFPWPNLFPSHRAELKLPESCKHSLMSRERERERVRGREIERERDNLILKETAREKE